MPHVDPQVMSAWLGLAPTAAASGMHTKVSAALWDICVEDQCVWEAMTRRSSRSHILWFALEPFPVDYDVDGRRIWSGVVQRYAAHIIRAGESARALWRGSGRVMHLYLPHELLVQVAQDAGHLGFDLTERGITVDRALAPLSRLLMDRVLQRDRLARLELDTLGMLACAHVLRCWSVSRSTGEMRGRLGAWQVKRATSFLMAHIDSDVGLADVAAHVGLSPFHFNRAFKRTIGVSPHRYLLLRRLDRAKALLATTALSVTAVAARVGYSDPNQLGRLFRNELGITPTEYRRQRRD